MMFVVRLQGPSGEPDFTNPFKAFLQEAAAISHAKESVKTDAELAFLFEVSGTDDPRRAIAAVKSGQAIFLRPYSATWREADIQRAEEAARKRAWDEGPEAMLQHLGL